MEKKTWSLSGFEGFAKGRFENSGQNLYVSCKGGLQRIWRFDVNNDGYVDIPVANSHGFNEHPKLYLIRDPAGKAERQEIYTIGAQSAAVTDLNGNGYDDLIISVTHDGHHADLASFVYFGGPDGITENRKVDLAAPACVCVGIGDFNGDGKKEICYLVADDPDESSAAHRRNIRLRIYRQTELGFRIDDFQDFPTDIAFFTVADVDGDGCDDLYYRKENGEWGMLWSEQGRFSDENRTVVGTYTDDRERFEILPRGGGNVIYREFARPKVLSLGGKQYLFHADRDEFTLYRFEGRQCVETRSFPVPNVISAAAGHITRADAEDLVLLQVNCVEDQHLMVFSLENGSMQERFRAPVLTPRDILLCDFSGSGRDDIVVVQGRDKEKFTSESLLFCVDEVGGIAREPRRFETHNCVEAYAGDFDGSGKPQLVFVNQQQSTSYGHVPVYVYLGSKDGYAAERRLEFPGHSAGTIIPADLNDDGWPDIVVLQNQEDQAFLNLPSDIYFGGPEGFSPERHAAIPAGLAWGGQCADLNHDGYLDLIAVGSRIRIFYGGPDGFKEENMVELDPAPDEPEGTAVGALWCAVADLNGNGWLDLIVPLSWLPYSVIYWGGPEGYSNDRRTLLPVDDGLTVRVADLTKNGYPDLVFGSRASYYRDVYNSGAVTIFWGGPEGYSGYNCCVLPSYQANNITIQDLNNDGWLDIFVSSYFNKRERDINSYIYWNDHGKFSATNRKRMFSHSSSAAWAGDFNEDGYVDLFLSHHRAYGNHNTDSAIWWNGPEGFKEENRTWLPTIGPHDMTPTDIGNVLDRSPEEWYITPAAKAEALHAVHWAADIPAKTWVNCQIRTAARQEDLESAPFVGPDGTEMSRFENGQAIPAALVRGPYFEIRLYLGAVNSGNTPRVTEIFST